MAEISENVNYHIFWNENMDYDFQKIWKIIHWKDQNSDLIEINLLKSKLSAVHKIQLRIQF